MKERSKPLSKHERVPKRLMLLVKTLISGLLLWLVLHAVDLGSVLELTLGANRGMIAAAVLLGIATNALTGVRWFIVIRAVGLALPLAIVLQVTMIGAFFNQFLPSAMGGDLVRIPYAHRFGLSLVDALKSVVLDRLVAFVGLTALVLACVPMSLVVLPEGAARWLSVGVAAGGALALALAMAMRRGPAQGLLGRLMRPVLEVSAALRQILTSDSSGPILASSLAVQLMRPLVVYLIAVGMSLPVSLLDCLLIVPPALLLTVLPISLGGWGVREVTFVAAFGLVGLQAEGAFALSAAFGLATLASSLPGALFWVLLPRAPQHTLPKIP